jgi:hypothetical protein
MPTREATVALHFIHYNFARIHKTPRHGTPPSPRLVVRSSNWRPDREDPCTTRWVCDWTAPPGASGVPQCPAAGCRSPEAESHISLPVLPVLRRSPVCKRSIGSKHHNRRPGHPYIRRQPQSDRRTLHDLRTPHDSAADLRQHKEHRPATPRPALRPQRRPQADHRITTVTKGLEKHPS